MTIELIQQSLYRPSLSAITDIYNRSMYDKDVDLFRIKYILDSLSAGQIESKQWAVDKLFPFITEEHDRCFVIGGWYGLFSHILTLKGFKKEIVNYDLDEVCFQYGSRLNKRFNNIVFRTGDGLSVFEKNMEYHKNIIVCTACEHIDRDELIFSLRMKNKDTLICLQSNNFFEVNSHINCSDTLQDFVDYLPLNEILYQESLRYEPDNYDRFMVIAK